MRKNAWCLAPSGGILVKRHETRAAALRGYPLADTEAQWQ